jgi:hypothetical protein
MKYLFVFFLLIGCYYGPNFNSKRYVEPQKATGSGNAKVLGNYEELKVNLYSDDLPRKECTLIATGIATKCQPLGFWGIFTCPNTVDKFAKHVKEYGGNTGVMGSSQMIYTGSDINYNSNGNASASANYAVNTHYVIANCKN